VRSQIDVCGGVSSTEGAHGSAYEEEAGEHVVRFGLAFARSNKCHCSICRNVPSTMFVCETTSFHPNTFAICYQIVRPIAEKES
jgi:hypothetical protein